MADTSLSDYVRADALDEAFVQECATAAASIVGTRVGTADVPADVRRAAILEVGANLFQRRQNRNGQASFMDPEMMASPHRPALDPMTPALPLLRPYLEPGIA